MSGLFGSRRQSRPFPGQGEPAGPAANDRVCWNRYRWPVIVEGEAPPGPGIALPDDKPPEELVARLRRSLLTLGCEQSAAWHLQACALEHEEPRIRYRAAWQLALWYAEQGSDHAMRQCLGYLDIIRDVAVDETSREEEQRKLAVMEAECLHRLGRTDEAWASLDSAPGGDDNPNLMMARANLEPELSARLDWINGVFRYYGIETVELLPDDGRFAYDRLHARLPVSSSPGPRMGGVGYGAVGDKEPLVSVIMPVHNAEDVIDVALRSVLGQSWQTLEVIVVDDASTDSTCERVRAYAQRDQRLRLIALEENGGPYVARNHALLEARGKYVTCHDADDWSHPRKLETQVRYLERKPGTIANTSRQARMDDQLCFTRRRKPGYYIFTNMSSFMFRREPVMDMIGYWDCIRFGSDSEFVRRVRRVFGEGAVVDIKTPPLSFQRYAESSLTGHSAFGFHGYFVGAREEYRQAHEHHHSRAASLRYDFPQSERPFAAPDPMKPQRLRPGEERKFDVIIASDFRMAGGSVQSCVEEVRAQHSMGLRTALMQLTRFDQNPNNLVRPEVRELLDADMAEMLVFGERAHCELLILRYPPVLWHPQKRLPEVRTDDIRVIINQPPRSDYGPDSVQRYDLASCERHLRQYFGRSGVWYPIGPLVRDALLRHHGDELSAIRLSDADWSNVISLERFKRPRVARRVRGRPRIGRHARGGAWHKWPADAEAMRQVYPDTREYDVRILGGASVAEEMLGAIPDNWTVYAFGEIAPEAFLADLDVFVYYTHPDWVESFGRVIIEAMAAGVPVILPPVYRPVFGDAACYAETADVQSCIDGLMEDDSAWREQAARGRHFVESRHSWQVHAGRLAHLTTMRGGHRPADRQNVSAPSAERPGPAGLDLALLEKEWRRAEQGGDTRLEALFKNLITAADVAVQRPLPSVVDKTAIPPSGDAHDWFLQAPHGWLDPERRTGFPFHVRAAPFTALGSAEAEVPEHDRTRTRQLFEDGYVLTLAWWVSGREEYARHARSGLERFFIDPVTAMNPHLGFSRVRLGLDDNRGHYSGLLEFRDLHYYLDAVSLLVRGGILSGKALRAFDKWLRRYLDWLIHSSQGECARKANNFHGICHDLQRAAIGRWLGMDREVTEAVRRARARMTPLFGTPRVRTQPTALLGDADRCCFTLQYWLQLAVLSNQSGRSLWYAKTMKGDRLTDVVDYLSRELDATRPESLDLDRLRVLRQMGTPWPADVAWKGKDRDERHAIRPRFDAATGIRPYWNLGLR